MDSKVEIIPAILPATFAELSEKSEIARHVARTAHLDTGDGVFTEPSWPYGDEDRDKFEALMREDDGLPYWERLDYEAHLMVAEPEKLAADWVKAGAIRIIAHVEAVRDFDALLSAVGDLTELILALKFETSLEAIKPFAGRIQGIHVMTIADIGRQGIPFEAGALARLEVAHAMYPELPISVDGGVSLHNAKALADAGASRLIVGSAFFESENPIETYHKLEEILR